MRCVNCGGLMPVPTPDPFRCPECRRPAKGHTPGPWTLRASINGPYVARHTDGILADAAVAKVLKVGGAGRTLERELEQIANANLMAAAPELLADATANDAAFTWLAEQMNSITDNAKHWNSAQIEALAQDLRVGIERNQKRTRAAIAKAEGQS